MATLADKLIEIDELIKEFNKLEEKVKATKQSKYNEIIKNIEEEVNRIIKTKEKVSLEECIRLSRTIKETQSAVNNDGGGGSDK